MNQDLRRRRDEVDRKVMEDIEKHGWSDISVFPTQGDTDIVGFNYTVGLTLRDHPEVMVLGLDYVQMHGILTQVYEQVKSGVVFKPDTYYHLLLNQHRAAFVEVLNPVDDTAYPMSMAQHLLGEIRGLQLVWPDNQDRFPWDPEFNAEYLPYQPLQGPWRGE